MNLFKGIDIRNPYLSRNPVLWWQYFCWNIQHWMMFHKPYYPGIVRLWALNHYGDKRYYMTWRMVRQWESVNPDWKLTDEWRPLPWWLGTAALGMFVPVWDRIQYWFRNQTGGRSHRCEFTSSVQGALYGGSSGAFMNAYFDRLIARISQEGDDD